MPPLATSSQPSSARPGPSSSSPDLVVYGDQRTHSSLTTSGSSRCSTAWIRSTSVLARLDRHRLLAEHGPRVDALVDQVHGHAGRLDARVESAARSPACRGRTGSSDGCTLTIRAGKRSRNGRRQQVHVAGEDDELDAVLLEPGRHRHVRASRSSCAARSNDGGREIGGARARSSARASFRFEATARIGRPASISACRFVPSPDDEHADHSIRPITRAARRIRDDRAVADAEVEDTAQLVLPDVPCEPVEDRRPLPGVPVDLARAPVRQHAREVPLDAAAGHVRERTDVGVAAERADVVEVQPRRREQVVAVVVLQLEHLPDEREAVRVDAGRREARRRRRPPRRGSRRSARRGRRSRRRWRRSRARPRGRRRAARPSRRRSARSRPPGRPPRRPRRARRPARGRAGSRPRSRAGTAARRRR